jgi:transcriptional regulator with XRE-family HTH domain
MPEPLWKIRKRKGLSVSQLAAKSGVPAISIREYESGQAIRSADLPKLAKSLYVEEWDIQLKGKPLPKPTRSFDAPPPSSRPALQPKKTPPSTPAVRPSQIEHLLTLVTRRFGQDRAALEQELGKPLEKLTRSEASSLLAHYQKLLAESHAPRLPNEAKAKRKRAYLPESVDEFELHYLTTQLEDEALLQLVLFDGSQQSGRLIGFGPYSITIEDAGTGEEITIQKLAIAYYRRIGGAG